MENLPFGQNTYTNTILINASIQLLIGIVIIKIFLLGGF